MVDTRFHRFAGPVQLGALLASIGREDLAQSVSDPDFVVTGVSELETADPGELAFAAHPSYAAELRRTGASVVLVSPNLVGDAPAGSIVVATKDTHSVFVSLLDALYPSNMRAIIAGEREDLGEPIIEQDVLLGANVALSKGVEIGRGSVIGANTVIGAGVTIGRNCVIGANVTLEYAHLGNNVVIHPGVRIGTEGFGWLDHGRSNRKIPQLGRAIIQDRVEIGANSTIDRGALGDTVIGDGTKVDNLVQIGHNCKIGRNCLIAAMSGLSGSTIVEDSVLLGGGVGTSGHLRIGTRSIVHGRAAVTKDWPAESKLAGAPAQDIKDFWRELAIMRKLTKGEKRG